MAGLIGSSLIFGDTKGNMTESAIPVLVTTAIAFAALVYLLHEKRIGDNNTLFFGCIIVLLYIISVIVLLPVDASDKITMGLISIASAIVGFLSRGIVEVRGTQQPTSPDGRSPSGGPPPRAGTPPT